MKHKISLFFLYISSSWAIASVVYFLLAKIMPKIDEQGYVFGMLPRMFLYHYKHPYQYIAVVAFVYGLMALIWSHFWGLSTGWKRRGTIIGLMFSSILLSSILGGVLWVFHDMQAGYFLHGRALLNQIIWGATTGLSVGWLVVMLSIPYNIIGVIAGYWITDTIEKRTRLNSEIDSSC